MASNSVYSSSFYSNFNESLLSLIHVEPSPMETPASSVFTSPNESNSSTSSVGLSSTGRGPIFYLTRLQRYSSYTFTLFAGLHFANTAVIPLIYRSVPSSEPFLLMTREIYQTRLSEPLLVGLPVLAHVASGLAVRILRRNQNKRRYEGDADSSFWSVSESKESLVSYSSSHKSNVRMWPTFSDISASGYVFAVLLTSHVAMNRLLPLVVDGDSSNIGLGFVSHGFSRHAPSAYFAYALLLSVGAGHMVWGMARWLDLAPPPNWKKITFDKPTRRRRSRAWWTVQGTALCLAGVWALGGLGVVARAGPAEGWLGTVYNNIYEFAGR